jgi:pyridinium-3,5-bisthiocarboxylic acid mononucleotide nickel chelatase
MIGWVDATAGASGDMLLAALLGAGVPQQVLSDAVAAVAPEPVTLRVEPCTRGGLAATRCHVQVTDSTTHRTWSDVQALLAGAELSEPVRTSAQSVFLRLATAEAAVHGVPLEDVHFHEVGALDAIADVVGVCAGFAHLGLTAVTVSQVAVGSGRVGTAHGDMPVPVPAVAELLRGIPSYAGPGVGEACTPTGAALLTTLATEVGTQPPMTVGTVGVGAGGRDPSTHANVVRLLVGEEVPTSTSTSTSTGTTAVVLETNVDDLDPRLWPNVLAALLATGASDAWLTPILMKKGRPAHTLSVLVRSDLLPAVRREVFRQTSTIGVREIGYGKTALARELQAVSVDGHRITVKVARLDGEVVNVQPEYDDVAACAAATGRPVKEVLAEAAALARGFTR